MELITRGNSSPYGKVRVYLTGYSKDIPKYIGPLAKMLLDRRNCAVYYDKEQRQYSADSLSTMNLAVIAVTRSMLCSDDPVFTEIFGLLRSSNIPVLPILTEKLGSDEMLQINRKLGEIQCLDPDPTNDTGISFGEKLENYLNSVLVKDDYISRIKEAFDAYIFISYRRKDREHADHLIDIIRRDPSLRDIAVWYDEFLVPGENFDDSIKKALEKSDLFVLNVTPSLNEDNYIQNIEYPLARNIGKKILPVEMVKTDKAELNSRYDDLPECIPCSEKTINEHILQDLSAIIRKQDDSDPVHNFFIGLAYLYGIDTKKDFGLAVQLITDSAKKGVPEAMKQLSGMYLTGNCIEKELHAAALWQERYAKSLYEEYLYQKTTQNAERFLEEYRALAEIYHDTHQPEKLIRLGQLLCSAVLNIEQNDKEIPRTYRINRYGLIGNLITVDGYICLEDYESALELGLGMFDWISRNIDHVHSKEGRAAAESDYKITALKLSRIYRYIYDFENQKKYSELAKRFDKKTVPDPFTKNTYAEAKDLAAEADAYRDSGDFKNAETAYDNAVSLFETLYAEEKDDTVLYDLCLARTERIRMYCMTERFAEAERAGLENLDDLRRLNENDSYNNRRLLLMALEQYSVILTKNGKLIAAFLEMQNEYSKAAQENFKLYPDDREVRKDLARYYSHNSELLSDIACMLTKSSEISDLLMACGAVSEPISAVSAINTALFFRRTARDIYYEHYANTSKTDLRAPFFALDLAESSKALGEYYVIASGISDGTDNAETALKKQAVHFYEECYVVLSEHLGKYYFDKIAFDALIMAGTLEMEMSDITEACRHFSNAANVFYAVYKDNSDADTLYRSVFAMTRLAEAYERAGSIKQAYDTYNEAIAAASLEQNYRWAVHFMAYSEYRISFYVKADAAKQYRMSAAAKWELLIQNEPDNETYLHFLKLCLEGP
ncbi:MAG: TIR domain-containing protein [Oscillospiraceae bacterium]